jgi:hypothetical protein
MCNQLKVSMEEFITNAALSQTETEDWVDRSPETFNTSAFLKKHSSGLEEAMVAASDLVLGEFCNELQDRRQKGDSEFAIMEKFEKQVVRHQNLDISNFHFRLWT